MSQFDDDDLTDESGGDTARANVLAGSVWPRRRAKRACRVSSSPLSKSLEFDTRSLFCEFMLNYFLTEFLFWTFDFVLRFFLVSTKAQLLFVSQHICVLLILSVVMGLI